MGTPTFHVAMFPWFAMGHLTPFLHLSNKLSERGHRISFLVPTKTESKLQHLNLHPNLITFVPLVVPHVEGLPLGSETMSDVPIPMAPLLATALDLMQHKIETVLQDLKPDIVFYDMAYWVPKITHPIGVKSIFYCIINAATITGKKINGETEIRKPLWVVEAHSKLRTQDFGIGMSFADRLASSLQDCDAICFRGCREIEGPYCDYMESQYKKPILLTGPVIPDPPNCPLEEPWDKWLGGFKKGSVVYCALGSEWAMTKDQFQELVLGLEFTGLPFFAALKVPIGAASIEEALPEGFEERVKGKGLVHGGWVQQQLILRHPSVGCFVSHCGFGSMWESMVSDCQIVLLPHLPDHFTNTKIMSGDLKVGVEIERRDEDGWFSREGVRKAVESVMNEESEVGKQVRAKHAIWKDVLLKDGFESVYLDNLVSKLEHMIGCLI